MEKIFINNNPNKIKNNFKVTQIDQRYGAAEIIRKSLQYRLGATIINDTKSINSIPKVPFNLLKNYIDFKKVMQLLKKNMICMIIMIIQKQWSYKITYHIK